MRRPPKKYGSALGMRRRTSCCQRLARFSWKYASKSGSMLRRPSVVLLMIGNSATSVAQITIEASGSRTQMMISGATATMGVTCSSTAYGNSAVSIRRLCTKTKEISTPITVAAMKASSVIFTVTHSARPSGAQSVNSVCTISSGEGTR